MIESLLMLVAIISGILIRSRWSGGPGLEVDYLVPKIMFVICVTQLSFYYFDLCDFRVLRERKKMFILLMESLGVSSVILAFVYYVLPSFSMGRGTLAINLMLILLFSLTWRLFYIAWSRTAGPKERVLIIGTGELAKKIKKEITENGYDGFEVIGFIDENGEKVGTRI